jgi:hypothetical protein
MRAASMRRTRLLCAIGVSVWSAVVAGSQAAAPVGLSAALRAHVKDERFAIVTSIRGLPLGVRDGLQTLFGSQTLDIAEPGAEFQVTDVIVDRKLPIRRLVAAGCSSDHCLVYYERGGIAHTWQVACFTGRRPRRGSSGAGWRHAAWCPSTMFGMPCCLERSKARPNSGRSRTHRLAEGCCSLNHSSSASTFRRAAAS